MDAWHCFPFTATGPIPVFSFLVSRYSTAILSRVLLCQLRWPPCVNHALLSSLVFINTPQSTHASGRYQLDSTVHASNMSAYSHRVDGDQGTANERNYLLANYSGQGSIETAHQNLFRVSTEASIVQLAFTLLSRRLHYSATKGEE